MPWINLQRKRLGERKHSRCFFEYQLWRNAWQVQKIKSILTKLIDHLLGKGNEECFNIWNCLLSYEKEEFGKALLEL